MKKISILKRKIIKAYNNPNNWDCSKRKGYKGYFGYQTLDDCIKSTLKEYTEYYGRGLKKWSYK